MGVLRRLRLRPAVLLCVRPRLLAPLLLGSAGETVSLEGSAGDRVNEGTVESADDRVFLLEAARGLDERERQILYFRYMKDLDPDEVANELGISRRQLSRDTQTALAKLRQSLEQGANGGAVSPVVVERKVPDRIDRNRRHDPDHGKKYEADQIRVTTVQDMTRC